MIAYRQRGFVNVYAFIINGVAAGLLLFYAQLIRFIPHIELSRNVNLLAYAIAVFAGMATSVGHVRYRGYTLHLLGWFGGIALATRQVLAVAACGSTVTRPHAFLTAIFRRTTQQGPVAGSR